MARLGVSERRACRVVGQARSTQRRRPEVRDDEDALTRRIIQLATCYGRYGYRRITELLQREGWRVNHKRVERIWRREGLRVPKRGRLWLGDGSCIRLRPTHRDHVWSYDFIFDRTSDGRAVKILTVIDEFTRESLALRAERSLTSEEVLEVLDDLFLIRGVPEHIRSDNVLTLESS
jgi:putative transposase